MLHTVKRGEGDNRKYYIKKCRIIYELNSKYYGVAFYRYLPLNDIIKIL